jgi:protein O-GlcNAc transferase
MPTLAELFDEAVRHHQGGQLGPAENLYRQVLQADPRHADAWHLLGLLAAQAGRRDLAAEYIGQALHYHPDFAEAHYNLGIVYFEQGHPDKAEASYRQALLLKPQYAEAHSNLGNALARQGRRAEAEASYREAIHLKPELAEAHNSLGVILHSQRRMEEALRCYEEALRFRPTYASAHSNVGNTYKDLGQMEEAIAAFRQAVRCQPDFMGGHSNLLYALLFSPHYDSEAVFAEHQRWNRQHAEHLGKNVEPHANDRTPQRRLKVGYVSADFRGHPIGLWMLPLLEAHDHANFEIYCYSSVKGADAITLRCRACADVWREAHPLSDVQLAGLIRQDQIDILVDLTMHMAGHRLLVFARKPAPVQVTYLAYPGTTGLTAVDYRLTDNYFDPPGQPERYYSEKCWRLPDGVSCYHPVLETPPVNALPALEKGFVTFGCLNNFCKVGTPTLEAWSQILKKVPESRMLLCTPFGRCRERLGNYFAERGIVPDRIQFVDYAALADYFWNYHRIDIALDPFPYGGGTTTCDALWMGVPVVTLARPEIVSRAGLSLLSNVQLQELVAHDVDEYVRIASDLAGNVSRLSAYRAGLRERLRASPMMDGPRFAKNMEAAFRAMWRSWCAMGDGVVKTGGLVADRQEEKD